MKKIFLLAVLVSGGFLLYKNYYSIFPANGAFDSKGNPTVVVFTYDDCGAPCSDVIGDMKKRNITFEEVNILGDEGKRRFDKFGENGLPLTVIGYQKVLGNDLSGVEAALIETYGAQVLSYEEQRALKKNFDDNGNPRVVMYGTSWCTYTKKMKAYFARHKIPYTEIDVERDYSGKMDYDVLKGIGYPLVYVGYRRINGYDEKKTSAAVNDLLHINLN